MDQKKQPAILFLDRNRFDFAVSGSPNVLGFQFNETIVSSLEVVNLEALEAGIKQFIDQNAIPPVNITIILSPNVVFEKDIAETVLLEQKEEEAQKFWDSVPFEDINSKSIKMGNGERIIVVNNGLCEALRTGFEKAGSSIEMIVPYEALGQDLWNITALDAQNSQEIMKRIDSFKQYAFDLQSSEKTVSKNNSETKGATNSPRKTPPKTRLYVMAGVFILLVLVLIFLLFKK